MQNYNIITLGPSGSGKTVFLASLFKAFSTQGKFGFSLEIQDRNKRMALNKIYADLTTGEKWPSGTRKSSEWVLTSYVKSSGSSKIPACKITYIDYKGGLITDLSEDEKTYSDYDDLELYTKEADAVLAILDGQKLLSFLEDHELSNNSVLRWLNEDLPNLIQMVDECNKYTPVHFVITKWDLIEGDYSLVDVKKRLLDTVCEFKNVVENRKKVGSPIRLIPVSSLGKGFAALQPDGQMKKISVNPHPVNVEFPLAFALTDKLISRTESSKKNSFKLIVWDWIAIGLCAFLILAYGLGLLLMMVYFGFRLFAYKQKKKNPKSNQTLSGEDAFEYVLNRCQELQRKFNDDFPESNLAFMPAIGRSKSKR